MILLITSYQPEPDWDDSGDGTINVYTVQTKGLRLQILNFQKLVLSAIADKEILLRQSVRLKKNVQYALK